MRQNNIKASELTWRLELNGIINKNEKIRELYNFIYELIRSKCNK